MARDGEVVTGTIQALNKVSPLNVGCFLWSEQQCGVFTLHLQRVSAVVLSIYW